MMPLPLSTLFNLWRVVFGRLQSIPHDDPDLTPENWCSQQPCRKIRAASREWIISQPLSSLWVYLLGLLAVGAGFYFFQIQQGEQSRLWWGISLLLWGIGALLAGTSYQALGYEIKCRGRPVCRWTSWWELVYLMFQQASLNAMLVAVAHSCTTGRFQLVLIGIATACSLIYVVLVFIGGIVPFKPLITFEFMVGVFAPAFFFLCCLNAWRYDRFGNATDLVLLGSWMMILGTMTAYWLHGRSGLTRKLWVRGIWFSENDVLHIGLIVWLIYVVATMAEHIVDHSPGPL